MVIPAMHNIDAACNYKKSAEMPPSPKLTH